MGLRVYFLRHGETTFSRTGGHCGALDPELTDEGLAMAEAFAKAYRHLPWSAVYVSPMRRTMATAQPLCDALGINLLLRDGLKEIQYGDWEGFSLEDVKRLYPDDYAAWMTEPAWNAPTGGETALQVANRSTAVLAEIESHHSDGNVLVVSHKATIRIMLCALLGIDLGRYRDRLSALVASISIVSFGRYGPMLEVLGDRSHLPPELRARPGT